MMRNKLTVQNINGTLMVDSREVSEILRIPHPFMLTIIDGFVYSLQHFEYSHEEFFIENAIQSKRYYSITQSGCQFIKSKLISEEMLIFEQEYTEAFNEAMEMIPIMSVRHIPKYKYRAYDEDYYAETELYTVTKIGEFLGLSSHKLNKLLENAGIQTDTRNFEFKINGGWLLNNEYEFLLQNQYLVPLKDIFDYFHYIPMKNLRWTEQGYQWLIDFLREKNEFNIA